MKTEFKEVIKLHNAGMAPEDISIEVGVSRATVYRWIDQHQTSLAMAETEEGLDDLDGLDDESELDVKLSRAELKQKELDLMERKLSAQEKKDRIENQKLRVQTFKEFKRMIEGIRSHCCGFTWSSEDLKKVYHEIDEILERVNECFGFDESEINGSSIFEICLVLKSIFKDYGNYKSVEFNFSDEKIEMLDYALAIDDFNDKGFDREDFNRQLAFGQYCELMDILVDQQDSKVNEDDVDQLLSKAQEVDDMISQDLPGISGEFEKELETVHDLIEFLKELKVRCEESFWGNKTLEVPEQIVLAYDKLKGKEE